MACDTLKHCFTTAPIIAYPNNDRVFCLEPDTSDFATRVVLSIEQNGKWHPVVFSFYLMTLEEYNYPVWRVLNLKWCRGNSRRGQPSERESHIHDFTLFNSGSLGHFRTSVPLNLVVSICIQYTISFSLSPFCSCNSVLTSVPLAS